MLANFSMPGINFPPDRNIYSPQKGNLKKGLNLEKQVDSVKLDSSYFVVILNYRFSKNATKIDETSILDLTFYYITEL